MKVRGWILGIKELLKLREIELLLWSSISVLDNSSHWIEVGNDCLRFKMELLKDYGVTKIDKKKWHVMWGEVKRELEEINKEIVN